MIIVEKFGHTFKTIKLILWQIKTRHAHHHHPIFSGHCGRAVDQDQGAPSFLLTYLDMSGGESGESGVMVCSPDWLDRLIWWRWKYCSTSSWPVPPHPWSRSPPVEDSRWSELPTSPSLSPLPVTPRLSTTVIMSMRWFVNWLNMKISITKIWWIELAKLEIKFSLHHLEYKTHKKNSKTQWKHSKTKGSQVPQPTCSWKSKWAACSNCKKTALLIMRVSHIQGKAGRVFQLRVGFGYWKIFWVGSGLVGYRVFWSNTKSIGYYQVLKSWSNILFQ